MDRGPGEVLRDIERLCGELITAGDEFSRVCEYHAGAELVYQQDFNKELVRIYSEGKAEGKIPAEDVRKAMAHANVQGKVWAEFLTSKAKKEALKVWIDTRQSVLSALQSELQQLRVEFTHA